MTDQYVVVCKDDSGALRLATRQIFATVKEAVTYQRGVAPRRHARVVIGDFTNMRQPKKVADPQQNVVE